MGSTVKRRFVVEVTAPRELRATQVAHYIDNAVTQWSKGGDPDDPLWNVKVTAVKNYDRVAQAERVKAGLRSNAVYLRVTPDDLRNAVSMIMFGGQPYVTLDDSYRKRVDDVIATLTGGA